jgi:RNA polymerase sigma factor (sigma-70 family)
MAQGQLVKQFLEARDAILGFIYALTRDFDVSEEIFQDVAMVILEEARRETTVLHFMPWAREIARRRVAEYFRKQAAREARERPSDSLTEAIAQAFVENESMLEEHRLRLQFLLDCLKRLSGRGREVIEGFYGRRRSVKGLAADMAWQENSVKVALSRARKVLADCINTRLRLSEAT